MPCTSVSRMFYGSLRSSKFDLIIAGFYNDPSYITHIIFLPPSKHHMWNIRPSRYEISLRRAVLKANTERGPAK